MKQIMYVLNPMSRGFYVYVQLQMVHLFDSDFKKGRWSSEEDILLFEAN